MRRVDGAAAEDHLARRHLLPVDPVLTEGDAGSAFAVEQQSGDQRVGLDLQIAAVPGLGEKRPRRRAAQPPPPRHLRIGDALLRSAVVILGERKAGLLGGLDKAVGQIEDRAVILDDQRAAAVAVGRIAVAAIGLRLAEERQHLVVAPAAAAHLRPVVVIGRVAAHVEHAVDRAGAAERLAARPLQPAVAAARLGLAEEIPVDFGVVEDAQHAGRDMDHRVAVGRPGFEQDDARAVLAQPAGDDAAGRPGANDHVIRFHRAPPCRPPHNLTYIIAAARRPNRGRRPGPAGTAPLRSCRRFSIEPMLLD